MSGPPQQSGPVNSSAPKAEPLRLAAPVEQPSAALPPPQERRTVYISAEAMERDLSERAARYKNLISIVEKNSFVPLDEFLRLEETKRLGASGKNPYLEPLAGFKAANFSYNNLKESGVVVFINGIPVGGQAAIKENGEACAALYGAPVFQVINNQHGLVPGEHKPLLLPNAAISVVKSISGLRRAEWGAAQESAAVFGACNMVADLVNADIPVRLVLHSQGTIIGSNAMTLLKRANTPEAWQRITAMVSVDAYAPAQLSYPQDLAVNLRAHANDPVVRLGEFALAVKQNTLNRHVRESDLGLPTKGGRTALPGSAHCFAVHVERMPEYYLAEKAPGELTAESGKMLAQSFVSGVGRGEYSDSFHLAVLNNIGALYQKPEARGFVLSFRDELNRLSPTGEIGNFVIPPAERQFFKLAQFYNSPQRIR